jgi:hypothetical protein
MEAGKMPALRYNFAIKLFLPWMTLMNTDFQD